MSPIPNSLDRLATAARGIQAEARIIGFTRPVSDEPPSSKDLYDELITDEALREATEKLFRDGHFASAVLEGFKFVNNLVKEKSGLNSDGAGLMRSAFSPKNPMLKLNDLKTQSKQDQQQGYMDIFAGCMTGIRNPRAHEHKYLDEPEISLRMLAWADHLVHQVRAAKRARQRKSSGNKP